MKLTVRHTLRYSLGTPARAVQHVLLTALGTPQQRVERWSIEMAGFAEAATFRDGFGNRAQLVSQVKPEGELDVTVTGTVETIDKAGVLGRLEYDPMPAMFRRSTELTKPDEGLLAGLRDGPDRIALFHEVMGRVFDASTTQSQSQSTEEQSQSQASASSRTPQVKAHAFIGALRAIDIPARYVTGYFLADDSGSSFHAWAEAWDENLGWIGFDPSLNLCPTENHIRVASSLDALSCPPLRTVPIWTEMPDESVEITPE